MAILPYYVANLNIEATYAAITGDYQEFPNLCFVDTLDNTYGLRKHKGHMDDLFGTMSDINVLRIRNQNSKRISVIIGNPPYNANQLNENEKNKNREYPEIDKRIKDTYIDASSAQKTKLYDMYARFFRWASDRLDENGVLALITNRSFIDSRTFDGFRAIVQKEFTEIRLVDLGGDVRSNPRLSGTKHNVFGIQTGVAISFMVKRAKTKNCRIYYASRPEFETAEEKLAWLGSSRLEETEAAEIRPDKRHNWITQAETDFDELIPIASNETKLAKTPSQEKAIFRLFSLGVVTNRDDWVYDVSASSLETKLRHFIDIYEADRMRWHQRRQSGHVSDHVSRTIKWTSELEAHLSRNQPLAFDVARIRSVQYRPFCAFLSYYDHIITHRLYQQDNIFPVEGVWNNRAIIYTQAGSQKPFCVGASNRLIDLHYVGAAAGAECVPAFRYEGGQRVDNITDWAIQRFRERYQPGRSKPVHPITKEAIFHYVYSVLHDPAYREKYAFRLKRDFPRIPFYVDFWQWAQWGKQLMELHIGYESVKPLKLKRTNVVDEKSRKAGLGPKCVLKADKVAGLIVVDSETTLEGVPAEAWEYRLGNRSALEWVLNQYKESTPKDPTIRERFNTYRFADYKEKVIDLLGRVAAVSVETQRIVEDMKKAPR